MLFANEEGSYGGGSGRWGEVERAPERMNVTSEECWKLRAYGVGAYASAFVCTFA